MFLVSLSLSDAHRMPAATVRLALTCGGGNRDVSLLKQRKTCRKLQQTQVEVKQIQMFEIQLTQFCFQAFRRLEMMSLPSLRAYY